MCLHRKLQHGWLWKYLYKEKVLKTCNINTLLASWADLHVVFREKGLMKTEYQTFEFQKQISQFRYKGERKLPSWKERIIRLRILPDNNYMIYFHALKLSHSAGEALNSHLLTSPWSSYPPSSSQSPSLSLSSIHCSSLYGYVPCEQVRNTMTDRSRHLFVYL